jgi:hypothetical protein
LEIPIPSKWWVLESMFLTGNNRDFAEIYIKIIEKGYLGFHRDNIDQIEGILLSKIHT